MEYGIFNQAVVTIYEAPCAVKETEKGTVSTIADEGLYGMVARVLPAGGECKEEYVPVKTFYGYSGFVKKKEIALMDEKNIKEWETSDLMVIDGFCVDIMSIPKVQGVCLQSLYRGALIQVERFESETEGWAQVRLLDDRSGYLRNQFLRKKEFSQEAVWTGILPGIQVEEEWFRQAVTETAKSYLGTQYRWGGKSPAGIDCSGLTSISYMLNGVLTYRDAKIETGYPVHQISQEEIKKGDLLYFPGHIAMYLGEGKYIHSTGRVGSGGVVINSLRETDADYREDLRKSLYAAGSIF